MATDVRKTEIHVDSYDRRLVSSVGRAQSAGLLSGRSRVRTPAGPTLRVPSHSTYTYLVPCGTLKNPHHCSKRVGDVDPSVVVNLHTSHHSHHGLGGYSKLTNGLRAMLRQMLTSELTVHILLTFELTVHMLKCIVGGHVCCSLIHSSRPRPYLKTTNRTERHLQICLP